jgi:mono/diheme cytochrome c family protein
MKPGLSLMVAATACAGLLGPASAVDRGTDGNRRSAAASRAPEVVRGEYLARIGDCISCHTARGGQPFAGGFALETGFGALYSPNITPDMETGIGKWTANDFWQAMHEGKSKNGALLYPAFPYTNYTKVTRADADAIFAYLKSLPSVRRPNKEHELRFPYNQRNLLIGWRALYFSPGEYKADASQSAEWNRGAYLVQGLGHCDACHTSRNFLGATNKDEGLAGGLLPVTNWYAPALTSNRELGLGDWDIKDLTALLKTGVSGRGAVFGPMAAVVQNSLQYLSDGDLRAIAVYLKSPGQDDAPADQPSEALYTAGAKIYDTHCKDCHRANGEGMPPAYPPLASNQSITMRSVMNPIRMVLNGGFPPVTASNPRPYGMPPFSHLLNDQEVAAVVTYVRQSWGNRASAVPVWEVTKSRGLPSD